VRSSDERILQEFFYSHEESTIYYRYFTVKKQLGHREAAHLCCLDYSERMAFGVFEQTGAAERFVAVGRYDLNARTNFAETAVVVGEQWRRRGIATYLLGRLSEYARTKGIDGFRSEILSDNRAMVGLHSKLGNEVKWDPDAHVYSTHRRLVAPRRLRTSQTFAAVGDPTE
jgi:GNAT superfamily N-acetyltransferase